LSRFLSWKPGPLPIPFYRAALSCCAKRCLLLLAWAELTKGSVKRSLLDWQRRDVVNAEALSIMSPAVAMVRRRSLYFRRLLA
jgi:hypothetical protein